MTRLGLALSGGGFRATLYHLGVVRFLRDADVLPRITHITAVSGGSILAAHLVQHWDQYCGSDSEFQRTAEEIVRFVKLDVRNRIVRRFPLAGGVNSLLRLARIGARRRLTRAGLLEQHYERFLYGDVPLSQLPDRPQLHIMATNLSEGCLCSFNRNGLLLQRRVLGKRDHFERVDIGLATIPMAVAASSAFPGFFPPLEIRAWDVGADEGEFKTQAFTDGGVYDNLGLRMFRYMDQLSVHDSASLSNADFLEFNDTMEVLISAESLPEQTPLRRIREMVAEYLPHDVGPSISREAFVRGLGEIIRTKELFLDPSFQVIELSDPAAHSLLKYVLESRRRPEFSDRIWLNRQILEGALRQVIGKPCLRINRSEFDNILVSDSGGKFKRSTDGRAGGLIQTGLRASDILMDRVWQMELEANEGSQGLVHIPITDVVDAAQDSRAPHREVQRQAARIRTDLDRFSDLEISALVQHGYCLARQACRAKLDLSQEQLAVAEPWDPTSRPTSRSLGRQQAESQVAIRRARRLRASSGRRIWSTLFSARDWVTYLWIPLILILLFSIPYILYKSNQRAQLHRTVLAAITDTNPVYGQILGLMESEPPKALTPMPFEEVASLTPADYTGFQFDSASRIFDLRQWFTATGDEPMGTGYTRIRARRTAEGGNSHLRLQYFGKGEDSGLTCQNENLRPRLKRQALGDGEYTWEFDLDFGNVPVETDTEFVIRHDFLSETASVTDTGGRLNFSIRAPISVVQIWVLMPKGRAYDSIQVVGRPIGTEGQAKVVVPDSTVELPYGSIAMFRLINPDVNYAYHCHWNWLE